MSLLRSSRLNFYTADPSPCRARRGGPKRSLKSASPARNTPAGGLRRTKPECSTKQGCYENTVTECPKARRDNSPAEIVAQRKSRCERSWNLTKNQWFTLNLRMTFFEPSASDSVQGIIPVAPSSWMQPSGDLGMGRKQGGGIVDMTKKEVRTKLECLEESIACPEFENGSLAGPIAPGGDSLQTLLKG